MFELNKTMKKETPPPKMRLVRIIILLKLFNKFFPYKLNY